MWRTFTFRMNRLWKCEQEIEDSVNINKAADEVI